MATSCGCASRPLEPSLPATAKSLRQVVVEGSSPTAGIIRDELTAGAAAMLGAAVPVVQQGVAEGALVDRHARELGVDSRPRLAGRADQSSGRKGIAFVQRG